MAGSYLTALAARMVAGAFSGLLRGMIAGYARKITPPHLAGKALAVAMAGTPVALSVGTPLGSLAGTWAGWRWTFTGLSVLAAVLVVWVVTAVPNVPGRQPESRKTLLRVLGIPGLRPVLAVVFTWMLAHNILYTYAAPFLAHTGVPGRVDTVLLVFGLASLAGIYATGILVGRALRSQVLTSLAGFAIAALALGLAGDSPTVFYATTVLWGLAFGGAATQLQTASADAADTDTAQAMVTVVWNLAIFGGAALGGALMTSAGAGAFPWVLLTLAALALVIVTAARRHAFPPGSRTVRHTTTSAC